MEDLCARVADTQGLCVSVPTMCHALQRLGRPCNKRHASERDTLRVQRARAAYHAVMEPRAVERSQCIDESGMPRAMTRWLGRAPRGERVVATVPHNYGPPVTMRGALSLQGLEAVMTVDEATDGDVGQASVEQVLGPTLVTGDVVLMENLSAHKGAGGREALERPGAQVLYVPPSSPDLSPLEPCWSKGKTALRQAKARTREALVHALGQGWSTVTAVDARTWFIHCGYTVQ